MRTFNYTPPPDELRALKAGMVQFINKPKGICSWHQGDLIIVEGWKTVTVEFEGTTTVFIGSVPNRPKDFQSTRPAF